jgi:Holliday junction resolvase RusA-like endonuclease
VAFGEREAFALRIVGPPPAKGRPRFGRGRTYTDPSTREAEDAVVAAWVDAGAPRLADGPLVLSVTVELARPRSHLRSDGGLSAAGRRAGRHPRRRPDLDNVAKAVMDALSGRAWRDDADVVALYAVRRWAEPGRPGCTTVFVQSV